MCDKMFLLGKKKKKKKNNGEGCHSLLQGTSPTQGLNPSLLYCRQILYCLNHQESLRTSCVLNHLFLPMALGTYSPIIPILTLTESSPRMVGLFAQGHKARNG